MEGRTSRYQLKWTKFWIILSMQTIFLLHLINAQGCDPPTKIECGQQGNGYYTAAKCKEDDRCCWNKNNIPNCYFKASAKLPGPECAIEPNGRTDCGDASSKPRDCLAKGCCWNATAKGKWCYYPSYPATTTTTLPPTTVAVTEEPKPAKYAECKCSVQGDPIVEKSDGSRILILGSLPVILFSNKKRQIEVIVELGRGNGMLGNTTVIKSVTFSKGGAGNKLIFANCELKPVGNAPKYDVTSASNPLEIRTRDDKFIFTYECNEIITKLSFRMPYESYNNDGGVCGVCPLPSGY